MPRSSVVCFFCGSDTGVEAIDLGDCPNILPPCETCGRAMSDDIAVASYLHSSLAGAGIPFGNDLSHIRPALDLLALTADPDTGKWFAPGDFDVASLGIDNS